MAEPRKKMLITREAAAELGISPRTLEKWRRMPHKDGSRRGPPWVVIEGQVRYPRAGIEEYVTKNTAPEEDEFVA